MAAAPGVASLAYLKSVRAAKTAGVERREQATEQWEKGKKKKVRWKRMYVGHVAAGIASMCHRGNHAGNAEAHLTTLPPCIYPTPRPSRIYLLSPYFHRPSSLFPPVRLYLVFSFERFPPRHVPQRNSRDAEIRTGKYGSSTCPRILIPRRWI